MVPLQSLAGLFIPICEDKPRIHPRSVYGGKPAPPSQGVIPGALVGSQNSTSLLISKEDPSPLQVSEKLSGEKPQGSNESVHPPPTGPASFAESRDVPGGPGVENLPSNARDAGLIPAWGTRIPHALGQLSLYGTTREA